MIASQYLCECGLLTAPADLDPSFEFTCPVCGTDAPLLFADADGQRVPYSAELTPEMVASQGRMGISA